MSAIFVTFRTHFQIKMNQAIVSVIKIHFIPLLFSTKYHTFFKNILPLQMCTFSKMYISSYIHTDTCFLHD